MECQFCGSLACEWEGSVQLGCTDCGWELADLALPADISPSTGAMAALERARAAWAKAYQQMTLDMQ